MKIHGLSLVRNEGDIIESSLSAALTWCDHIYVYDNGSTDDTWEKVKCLSRKYPQIIPFKRKSGHFSDSLRGEIFNYYRNDANEGDWWCRLDADEFYIDEPKTFLKKIGTAYQVVWGIQIQYYFTEKDFAAFESAPSAYLDGFQSVKALRYYRADASEERFVMHRPRLVWDNTPWPRHMGIVAPQRVRIRHFKYRFPKQIEERLAIRREARASGYAGFAYSQVDSWKEKLIPSDSLSEDTGDGTLIIDETTLPRHTDSPVRKSLKGIMRRLRIWP